MQTILTSHSINNQSENSDNKTSENFTQVPLLNTEESSSFVPSIEKDSQAFKDPLAATIPKRQTDLLNNIKKQRKVKHQPRVIQW